MQPGFPPPGGFFPPNYPYQYGQPPRAPLAVPPGLAVPPFMMPPQVPLPIPAIGIPPLPVVSALPLPIPPSTTLSAPPTTTISAPGIIVSGPTVATAATLPLTLYVGKLPSSVEDSSILKLLQECGRVMKWNRPVDSTKALKPFGFCTFELGSAALRCMNVLDGMAILDSVIQVKAGTKEQVALDSIRQEEEREAEQILAAGGKPKDRDGYVRDRLLKLIDTIVNSSGGEADDLNDELQREIDAPSAVAIAPTLSIVPTLSSTVSYGGMGALSLSQMDDEGLDDLETKERLVQSEIEKFRQRQAIRDKEVEQQRKAKLQQRLKEFAAAQASRKEKEELEARKAIAMAVASNHDSKKDKDRDGKRPRVADEPEDKEAKLRRKQMVLAMVTGGAEAAGSSGTNPTGATPISKQEGVDAASGSVKVDLKLGTAKAKPMKAKIAASTFVGTEEEQTKASRTIIPIDYSEEERRAGGFNGLPSQTQRIPGDFKKEERDRQRKERLKEFVDRIPTDRKKLFAYEVNWEAVETYNVIEVAMRSWVSKKMLEYLGEVEDTLSDFILAKLRVRVSPDELLGELEAVLDEDAIVFVLKLWRMLIFSALKAQSDAEANLGEE